MVYGTYYVGIDDCYHYYQSIFFRVMQEHKLYKDDYVPMYDWLINECLSHTLYEFNSRLTDHYRHDLWKGVYQTECGVMFQSLNSHLNNFTPEYKSFFANSKFKSMVLGRMLILSRELD